MNSNNEVSIHEADDIPADASLPTEFGNSIIPRISRVAKQNICI